jgi:hypothetical protein
VLGGGHPTGGRVGGVREIKGLEGGVNDLVRIGFAGNLLRQGNGRNPASASLAMTQDQIGQ